jgi:RNA polymerase sigma-B factor
MPDTHDREDTMRPYRELRDVGDRTLRDRLLEEHRWIAVHCARRFAGRGEPFEDLLQVGQIGLMKALQRFDPEYGAGFTTFAMPTVLGDLRRHFRDATWAVRVPRRLKDLHVELAGATEFLTSVLERTPTPAELALHLDVSVDDVLEAIEAGGGYRSTPLMPPPDDDERPSEAGPLRVEDAALAGADDRVFVQRLLGSLPRRERRIVELRFFDLLTQAEIAGIVGLSQVHVSRLLRASLATLQRAASGEEIPGAKTS